MTAHPFATFGLANTITLTRLIGALGILALLLQAIRTEPTVLITVIITTLGAVCLILDGVDGRVARARGETSPFGARFDIETDAVTTLILTVALAAFDVTGWWVITIGALRYLYLLAAVPLPALRAPLPHSQLRRVIGLGQAVLLLITLLLAHVPHIATLPALGLAALLYSFTRDTIHQLRQPERRAA